MTDVATPQRRDVNMISASTSLKSKGPEIEGDKKKYRRGHGTNSSNDPDQWRGDLLLYFLLF